MKKILPKNIQGVQSGNWNMSEVRGAAIFLGGDQEFRIEARRFPVSKIHTNPIHGKTHFEKFGRRK